MRSVKEEEEDHEVKPEEEREVNDVDNTLCKSFVL